MIPLQHEEYSPEDALRRVREFADDLARRRTVRAYSDRPVDRRIIETILEAANTAPSGANKQPWTFVAVSDPEIKAKIREAAEEEEKVNYGGRMSDEWIEDLRPLRTTWKKEFLDVAPWLIVVFAQSYGVDDDGRKRKHYYVQESVGLACGMLLAAAHRAGLATLTHTPSPMGFLSTILNRPKNERPFLLIPIGYPADDATVPQLAKKSVDDVTIWMIGRKQKRDQPAID
jgi:nitroreductase